MLPALKNCCAPLPQRYVFAFMGFLALVMAYGMRVSLSIAITMMTKEIVHDPNELDNYCQFKDTNQEGPRDTHGADIYDWSEKLQGIILSSFYVGYVVTQIPGGILAERFGGKHTVGLGMVSTALLTVLIPLSVSIGGAAGLITLRVLMGLCEGVTLPALNVMISQWTPPEERSKTGSFVYVGAPIGVVFTTAFSGLILKYYPWPIVFYFYGALGAIWFVIWCLVCYNTPADHPYISDVEATYLSQALSEYVRKDPPPVPWSRMLRSMPLWALVAVQVGHDWGFYTVATDLPKYMANVLRFEISKNGLLSSIPYIGMWLCCSAISWVADWIITNKYMPITRVRKLGTTIASIFPGTFIVLASLAKCDRELVVTMFVLGITFLGAGIPSLKVNALDLSPNYAGTVMAISNGAAACTGILTPYVVGLLTPHQTLSEWRVVFLIIFGVLIATNIFYLIFASGEVQDWNDPDTTANLAYRKKKNKVSESVNDTNGTTKF